MHICAVVGCGKPCMTGRVLCRGCLAEYEISPEHNRAAVALHDWVRRVSASRKNPFVTCPGCQQLRDPSKTPKCPCGAEAAP